MTSSSVVCLFTSRSLPAQRLTPPLYSPSPSVSGSFSRRTMMCRDVCVLDCRLSRTCSATGSEAAQKRPGAASALSQTAKASQGCYVCVFQSRACSTASTRSNIVHAGLCGFGKGGEKWRRARVQTNVLRLPPLTWPPCF